MIPKNKKINITVLVLVVIFILFLGTRSKQEKAENLIGSQYEKPTYAEVGPYSIGTQDLLIENEGSLLITMWYPAEIKTETNARISYPYKIKMGKPFGTVSIASSGGQAIKNASYNLSDGPYPPIILSPGFSIGNLAYAWLAEHLASYGFVVIAPEHIEHLDPEDQLWRSAITRPLDILAVLNFLDEQIKTDESFKGLINSEHIAIVGHSYGGYTTLAAAGAKIDSNFLQSHCQNAIDEKHEAAWMCEILLSHLADMAELAGFDNMPNDLWPSSADPRVAAIMPIAGDAFFFGQSGLAEIQIPVMAIGGTADQDSPFSWGTQPSYEFTTGPRKAMVALKDAEHMIFTGPCEKIPFYIKFFSGEFCSDTSWNRNYAHALVKHFSTAFLLAELKQDQVALRTLSEGDENLIGIDYNQVGY